MIFEYNKASVEQPDVHNDFDSSSLGLTLLRIRCTVLQAEPVETLP
jgi:hypothetical protein